MNKLFGNKDTRSISSLNADDVTTLIGGGVSLMAFWEQKTFLAVKSLFW